jgi:hypothetical protein
MEEIVLDYSTMLYSTHYIQILLLQSVLMEKCNNDHHQFTKSIRWVWKLNNDDWVLEGLLESTPSTITSIQTSPFSNQLAVGTTSGTLLVCNFSSPQLIFPRYIIC